MDLGSHLKLACLMVVQVEYVEIYADELRDLLRTTETPRAGGIVIRESPARGTYIENAE